MKIKFYKYHGTGNDFIMLNNLNCKYNNINSEIIKRLCHRKFGIGADGLILLNYTKYADFSMDYYNSDGNSSTMCGNGGRCITAFAKKMKIIKDKTSFLASDGLHKAFIDNKNIVTLKMIDVNEIKNIDNVDFKCYTGSPHLVKLVKNINNSDVYAEGKKIRYSKKYRKKGINVNFVEITDKEKLYVRTYERGVEKETLSCGTGAVASAISYAEKTKINKTILVKTKGGKLSVSFERTGKKFHNIWLTGTTNYVFKGTFYIDKI